MTYRLQIVTPDGIRYDGQAERLLAPAVEGEVMILPRHINYVTALKPGCVKVTAAEGERLAACMGGMLTVNGGEVKLAAPVFEWADEIDIARAENAQKQAEAILASPETQGQHQAAKADLHRAQLRLKIAAKRP